MNRAVSFGVNSSPSNNCLERSVTHLVGRRFAPLKSEHRVERLMRRRAAAQARRLDNLT
jgi:hypothetical protein